MDEVMGGVGVEEGERGDELSGDVADEVDVDGVGQEAQPRRLEEVEEMGMVAWEDERHAVVDLDDLEQAREGRGSVGVVTI